MNFQTTKKREVIDITDHIVNNLNGNGVVHIFVAHTTAAITTADLDPGTAGDYLTALKAMTPLGPWNHPHDPDHFPDHMWATLIGLSLSVPFKEGRLLLGSWQRIVLIELDGPRQRTVEVIMSNI